MGYPKGTTVELSDDDLIVIKMPNGKCSILSGPMTEEKIALESLQYTPRRSVSITISHDNFGDNCFGEFVVKGLELAAQLCKEHKILNTGHEDVITRDGFQISLRAESSLREVLEDVYLRNKE